MPLLYYRECGAADESQPTLLFLHGLFGSSVNWNKIARALQEDWHIVAPDLRNHGQSFHDDAMSYPIMASDVANLMDVLSLDNVVLIAHSMGGKVAMLLAESVPLSVSGLIVADIAPIAYQHDFSDVLSVMQGLDLSRLESRGQAQQQLQGELGDAAVAGYLLQNLSRDGKSWSWRLNLATLVVEIKNITGFPADFPCPAYYYGHVLFLAGEYSDYLRGDAQKSAIAHYPQASIQTVEQAGHWVYAEQPEQFLRYVRDFLRQTVV